jgi:hypothetical protein
MTEVTQFLAAIVMIGGKTGERYQGPVLVALLHLGCLLVAEAHHVIFLPRYVVNN